MRDAWLHIDSDPVSVQQIMPQDRSARFEGAAFSGSGKILAIVTSEFNSILLFRCSADGRFEDEPYQTIGGSDLNYPHDVSFSHWNDGGLLAVAQRGGAIAIYTRTDDSGLYSISPTFLISGEQSKLAFSDGVAFLPPDDLYLAACDFAHSTICFFRRVSLSPPIFETAPELELKHESIYQPDGLCFSSCGQWLACANHGKQTIAIFRRAERVGDRIKFERSPEAVIKDPGLRYPHSVGFTPMTNQVIVTNAGANYFAAYPLQRRRWFGTRYSYSPRLRVIVHDEDAFKEVNMTNKMEGGPKGIAIAENMVAICSPQIGAKIYRFREGWKQG
jgi:6-phosphogluconolactonase (cycloisomerase 2 family)